MRFLVEIKRNAGGGVSSRKIKGVTDSRHKPRGGEYVFVEIPEGLDRDYAKIRLKSGVLEAYEDAAAKNAKEYLKKRRREYPSQSKQFDYIFKALKFLKDNNVDIGVDGDEYVDLIQGIKDRYPKP